MIYFDKVSKTYRNSKNFVVKDINLSISSGEFISIVGHSGAGKTTLLKMLMAEERPTSGSIFIESVNVSKLQGSDLTNLRKKIGAIFQDFRLIPDKTVYENIAFAMEVAGRRDEEIAVDVPHVLDLVDLRDKIWDFPKQLSGGEQQRVAIARAIVNQPDILIADEPTGNLDPVNTYEIVQILKKINEFGTTVILTTHNKGIVDSIGGRVITMDDGKIVRDDKDGNYAL